MKNSSKNRFNEYELSKEVLDALTLLEYLEPTEIQKRVLPMALQGRDIVAKSQTGSGKTAAFAIPICEKVVWEENAPQALVLEPTRELAEQVKTEIFHIGRRKRLKVPAVLGGFPIEKQIQSLRQKSHIVVGTPGRIMDHLRRESLNLEKIKYLVIDEADLMLNMGFIEEVEQIMEQLPKEHVTMLFSATMGEELNTLIEQHMKEPKRIILESKTETVEEVTQILYEIEKDCKYEDFLTILAQENPEECMIFCGTRDMVNVLHQKLKRERVRCGMLHGEMEQRDRLRTIEEFREGRFHYLIATDVAARGVDFENITHVFNYDFPTGKETYVHRIGRTGRNGKSGKAVSLVTEDDIKMKQMVEEYIGMPLELQRCPLKGQVDAKAFWNRQKERVIVKAKKGAVFNRTITKLSIGGGRKSKMRAVDIVGCLCNIEGITSEDIGIIDVRDSLTYVEILHGKGKQVVDTLQDKPIKGKIRKVRVTRV